MPIALLLQDLARTLTKGSTQLNPWTRLVEMEEMLIDRARSAFLVHWFGTGLPMNGLSLKIHIANLPELQARYDEIQRQQRPERWGMNLVTPLSGALGALGGSLVGAVVNPVVLVGAAIWGIFGPSRDPRPLGQKILGALRSIGLILLRIVLIPVGIPLGIAAGVQHGGADRQEDTHTRGIPERGLSQLLDYYQLGGALADLLAAARPFIEQLIGPRDRVRNPLLRAILAVGDLLAGLMSQLIGFAAILVDRVAPLIVPLVTQGIAFYHLVGSVMEMVNFLLTDLSDSLSRAFSRVGDIFTQIKNGFFGLIMDAFVETGYVFTYLVRSIAQLARSGFTAMMAPVLDRFRWARDRLRNHPVVQTLIEIPRRLRIAGTSLDQIWTEYSSRPSGLVGRAASAVARGAYHTAVTAYHAYRAIHPSTSPPAPSWPGTPDAGAMMDYLGRPQRGLEDLGLLPEVVARQRYGVDPLTPSWIASGLPDPQTLEQQLQDQMNLDPLLTAVDTTTEFFREQARRQGNPTEALRAARARELPFRDYFTTVLGRLLPAEARMGMGGLLGLFHTIDRQIYGLPESRAERRDFPVLSLPDSGELRPHLHRVVFRVPEGTDEDMVRTFKDRLVERLRGQRYPAPGGA